MTTVEKTTPQAAKLLSRFHGDVIVPSDERYDAARQLWNASIDRRPAAIVRPRTALETATVILHAREHGMEIAVRGGGHSVPGHSMSEGGITIDLSTLSRVVVDPVARRARVGGGALLSDVGKAAAPHALTMPYGTVSHTGVGGLTLGGGIGWVMRRYGLAVDSVRSLEIVTASGEVLRASGDENPDLFWAVRGGGGNFGVVTEFEFDLHPLGPNVLAGMVLHPLDRAADALRFSRDFMDEAPDELTLFETFMVVPPVDPLPDDLRGRPALVLALTYAGSVEDGERLLRPLRECGPPAFDLLGPMPIVAAQAMVDDTAPLGMRNYNKAHWLAEFPDDAIDQLVEHHGAVPSPMSLIMTGRMGGAVSRVSAEETAFGYRDAHRVVLIVSAWWQGDDAEQIEWCQSVFEAMTPYSTGGVYVNFLDAEGPERVRAAYRPSIWRRLVEAKARWDPENLFRLNYNIPPSPELADARTT